MKGIRAFALASVSFLSIASPAFAQDTAAQGADETGVSGDEIVVQARRRDESTQEVPAVINPVTAADIAKLNLRKFEDIASVVPGLAMSANANGIGVKATIRGVNYDVNVSGNNGTIQFYQNDVPVAAGLLFNSLFDVGQVEVLRGPQGTLKGRSAPSGAITLYTKRPDLDEAGGKGELTVNDIHGWNFNAALNVPVIADKLGVRIAGVVNEGQGNRVHDLVDTTTPRDKTRGIRAAVKADPFDGLLDLDFTYQSLNRKSLQFGQSESINQVSPTAPASPVTIRAKDRLSAIGLPQTNDQDFKTYDWQAALHLYGQTLTYVGGVSKQHLLSFAPSDIGGVFATDSDLQGTPFGQPTDTSSYNRSHEIRLQNEERIAGIFDYVVGYLNAYADSDTSFKQVTGIALAQPYVPTPQLVSVVLTPLSRFSWNKEESFYGNLTAHIGEGTEISGGLRHIKYHDVSGLSVGGVVVPTYARDLTESKTVYQASIKHQFTDSLMVYASTGTSWRPSTVAIGGPTGGLSTLQASFLSTPPETSESYEVGLKSDFLDKTLRVNLTGYYQKYKNYPYRSSSGIYAIDRSDAANPLVRSFNYVAAVPVEVKGVEAEVSYEPSKQFNIGATVSYSKGTISNGSVPCLDLNKDGVPDVVTQAPTLAQMEAAVGSNNIAACNANFNATLSPRWSASLQSEYNHPLTDGMEGYVRGLFTWKGDSDNDPVNVYDDVKSYGILNLYAGVRDPDGAWEVSLFAKNITNTFRVLTRSNGPASTVLRGGVPLGGAVSSGSLSNGYFNEVTVTEPREFGINLKFAFGSR